MLLGCHRCTIPSLGLWEWIVGAVFFSDYAEKSSLGLGVDGKREKGKHVPPVQHADDQERQLALLCKQDARKEAEEEEEYAR